MSCVERKGGIVWALPPAKASDEEIDGVLADLVHELGRGRPYVLVFDLTLATIPNAAQRRKLAAHMHEHEARIRSRVRGVGVVVSSAPMRGAITAIFWMAAPPIPHRVFQSRSLAVEWASSLC